MALYRTLERIEEGLLGGLKLLPPIKTFNVCDSFFGNAARSLGMTRYTVRKILRKVIGKRAFRPCKTERLTPSQQLRRVTMSRLLLAQPNLSNKLKHVWFTDESWFTTDGITKKTNQFYWALNKDAVKPVISQKYPIKVHVWASVKRRWEWCVRVHGARLHKELNG